MPRHLRRKKCQPHQQYLTDQPVQCTRSCMTRSYGSNDTYHIVFIDLFKYWRYSANTWTADMTPFSFQLKTLRSSRNMRQNVLAAKLGIDAGSLCSLENGRRPPPRSDAFYTKLGAVLNLSDDESKELRNLAELTRKFGSALSGTSPYQLRVALEFSQRLPELRPSELRAIEAILDMGRDKDSVSLALACASDTR